MTFSVRRSEEKRPAMTKWAACLVFVTALFILTIFAVLSHTYAREEHTTDCTGRAPHEQTDRVVVQTKYGPVRGIDNNGVREFHGVPYAQPPTGEMRWRSPVEPKPWPTEIFDATKKRPGCPQDCAIPLYCTNQTSEDCLFLEIYTPSVVTFPVPVMLYIHGGGFKDVTSTVPIFDSMKLVQRSGIIVVLVEYRIGALGFLYTGTGEGDAKGNYGLLDQRLAMVWVRDNIGSFGGDPAKITIAGQSAGAQSALIHLDSVDSSRYFRSAIIESPPLSLLYQTPKVAVKHGRSFAEILECVGENSTVLNLPCLRNKTVAEVLRAQEVATDANFEYFWKIESWGPVVDGTLVTGQPLKALSTHANSSTDIKPMIWGYTAEEALIYVTSILASPVPEFMYEFLLDIALTATPKTVTKLYPVTNPNDTRDDMSVLFTDAIFRCPLQRVVQSLAQATRSDSVWVYKWDTPIRIDLPELFRSCNNRTCHGTQIPFVFQSFDKILGKPTSEDIRISNIIIDYYTNFIKFGNPNGEIKYGDQNNTGPSADNQTQRSLIYWPAVKASQLGGFSQLVFTRDGKLEVTRQDNDDRCNAWNKTNFSLRRR